MKLLFDENLSPNLPGLVMATFPGSEHVREIGLKGRTDEDIWDYARVNGFAIISKDKDFYQRALLYGSPPKFIWLRLAMSIMQAMLTSTRLPSGVMKASSGEMEGAVTR
jgi:predicted nuclease of predicted toxin-antitoxin system